MSYHKTNRISERHVFFGRQRQLCWNFLIGYIVRFSCMCGNFVQVSFLATEFVCMYINNHSLRVCVFIKDNKHHSMDSIYIYIVISRGLQNTYPLSVICEAQRHDIIHGAWIINMYKAKRPRYGYTETRGLSWLQICRRCWHRRCRHRRQSWRYDNPWCLVYT